MPDGSPTSTINGHNHRQDLQITELRSDVKYLTAGVKALECKVDALPASFKDSLQEYLDGQREITGDHEKRIRKLERTFQWQSIGQGIASVITATLAAVGLTK